MTREPLTLYHKELKMKGGTWCWIAEKPLVDHKLLDPQKKYKLIVIEEEPMAPLLSLVRVTRESLTSFLHSGY